MKKLFLYIIFINVSVFLVGMQQVKPRDLRLAAANCNDSEQPVKLQDLLENLSAIQPENLVTFINHSHALAVAAGNAQVKAVDLLLQYNANVNGASSWCSPLCSVIFPCAGVGEISLPERRLDIVRKLHALKADVVCKECSHNHLVNSDIIGRLREKVKRYSDAGTIILALPQETAVQFSIKLRFYKAVLGILEKP